MADSIEIKNIKNFTSENMARIISILRGLMDTTSSLADQCINPYNPDEVYTPNRIVVQNNYLWICRTVTTGVFDESKWHKLTDDFKELTKSDIELLINLSPEEIKTLQSIIDDSVISLSKVHSSSKLYSELQENLKESKDYTLKEISKASGASYKVVTSIVEMIDEKIIYLLANETLYDMYIVEDNGNPLLIGSLDVNLSDYYTKDEANAEFLKIANAESTYATIEQLENDLKTKEDTITYRPLPSGSDFNDCIEKGKQIFYQISNANYPTALNTPYTQSVSTATVGGFLISYGFGVAKQIFFNQNSSVFIRSGYWGDSGELIWNHDFKPVPIVNDATDSLINAYSSRYIKENYMSIENEAKQQGENLIEYPYDFFTRYGTGTRYGVSYSDTDNGIILSGKVSSSTGIYSTLWGFREDGSYKLLRKGTYTLSGMGISGTCTKAPSLQVRDKDQNRLAAAVVGGEGVTFTIDEDKEVTIGITAAYETEFNNILIQPMLEYGTVAHRWQNPKKITNDVNYSNLNILDNSFFTINQREKTEYNTTTSVAYTLDRWYSARSNIKIVENGISLAWNGVSSSSGYIAQKIDDYEKYIGKTVTISIIINGNLYSLTGAFPTKGGASVNTDYTLEENSIRLLLEFTSTMTNPQVAIASNKTTENIITAVKLELGSVSTLANDVVPNYATELSKCQRYFQRISGKNMQICFLGGANSTTVYFPLTLETTMRNKPTLTCSSLPFVGAANANSSGATNQASELVVAGAIDGRNLEMKGVFTTAVDGISKLYLTNQAETVTWDFSAEL